MATLEVNASGGGTVTSDAQGIQAVQSPIQCGTSGTVCKLQFPLNTVITLTASADAGSAFGSWNAPCELPLEPGKCKITLTGDVLVNAVFTLVPPDFILSATPASQSVAQGGSVQYDVTASLLHGSATSVSLSLQSACPATTCSFGQAVLDLTGGSAATTLTVSTTSQTGQFSLVIRGTGGGEVREATVQLTVTGQAAGFTFSLGVTPLSQSVSQGASVSFTAVTTLTGGAAQSVNLSVNGCPPGATCTFDQPSVTPTASSLLTVATAGGTPLGAATLEIIADAGGGVIQQVSVQLTTTASAPVAANPPRFAYVANNSDGTLSIFTVNGTTGQLRHRGYVKAGLLPVSVASDPAGKFVYVANKTQTGIVAGFAANATTGQLTPLQGSPFTAGSLTEAVVVHPNGQFLYAVNSGSQGQPAFSEGTVSAFNIGADGALTTIPGSPFPAGKSPRAMAIHPTGKFGYVANYGESLQNSTPQVTAFQISQNGTLQPIALQNIPVNPAAAIVVDPTGKFVFTANEIDDSVSGYAINTVTGALTKVQGSPFGTGGDPNSIAADPLGRFLYVSNESSKNVSGYAIDSVTGRLTALPGSPYPVGAVPQSISVDPSGHFVYTTNFDAQPGDFSNNTLTTFSIDQNTGALTSAGVTRGREDPSAMAFIKGPPPVTYTPTFAYTANHGSNDLSGFQIDSANGQLAAFGAFPAGSTPRSAAITPNGQFLYAANELPGQGNGQVSGFAIQVNGALNAVPSQPVEAGQGPSAATVEPSGRFVYVTNRDSNNVSGYQINLTTGTLSSLGGAAGADFGPVSVSADPTGQFLYVVNRGGGGFAGTVKAYTIDLETGLLNATGSVPQVGTAAEAATVDPTGRFVYVASPGSSPASARIYGFRVRPDGGLEAMPGSPFAAGAAPVALAADPTGKYLFVANRDANTLSVFRIDSSTGALSLLSTVGAGTRPDAVTVDISGRFVYVATLGPAQPAGPGAVTAFSLDLGTGVLSPVPGSPFAAGTQPVAVSTTGTIQ
jgi:6-phosphogluconolactonase (cycloisomerase 2 family)